MEELTVAKARAGIEKLVHLTPQTARVIADGKESIISAQEVKLHDVLKVLPGETVPVDGMIISGQTSVNQAVMTGESLPVDKTVGDEVSSGTVNQCGAFEMLATKVGEDSSIQRMIRLVQSADAGKAKIVGIADRWATWIVVIALSAAVLTWLITGKIIRAVTILVVFCPCALVLATPTAIMAAICAAAEASSEHPLGKAIVRCFTSECSSKIPEASDFKMIPGRGVSAKVEGYRVLAGNKAMLTENNITISPKMITQAEEYINQGCTVIYLALDSIYTGCIVLSDTIRSESAGTIKALTALNVQPVLLTGDNEKAAAAIADQLGIFEVHANCLPEDKLKYINEYQNRQEAVCMIGDGINDAPALKAADVGIAMGGVGSDIAVDAADIALVDDEVKEFPHLLALSKRMMTTIKINMSFSMGLNFIAIILAIMGTLDPVVGALVHNAGSVLVITNSALLLKWRNMR